MKVAYTVANILAKLPARNLNRTLLGVTSPPSSTSTEHHTTQKFGGLNEAEIILIATFLPSMINLLTKRQKLTSKPSTQNRAVN